MCITWKLNEGWPLTKDLSTLLQLLKLLKLKNNYITALWLLKFLILKKELHHFLMTLKVFNTEQGHHCCFKVFNTKKGLHRFLRILTVFVIEKGLHHFFETLKGFNFEKWLHQQPLLKVSYHITFMIDKLHLLCVPSFIVLGIYFLFATKFSCKEETDTCF